MQHARQRRAAFPPRRNVEKYHVLRSRPLFEEKHLALNARRHCLFGISYPKIDVTPVEVSVTF
jgi:hypothetical protein